MKSKRYFSNAAVLVSVLLLLLTTACSNTRKNEEIFNEFEGTEGVFMIKLPPGLFLGLVGINGETEVNKEEIGDIKFVKLLVFDQNKTEGKTSKDILSRMNEKLDNFGYDMVIQYSSSDTDISVFMLENEAYVSDLIVLAKEEGSMIGLGLSGKLDSKAIMGFASSVDYDDLRNFIDTQ